MSPTWSTYRKESVHKLYPGFDPEKSPFAINEAHLTSLDKELQSILASPDFDDIQKRQPLTIRSKRATTKDGGGCSHISAYDPKEFKMALQTRRFYTCGGNLLWCSPFFSAFPGVPLNARGLKYCADYHFKNKEQLQVAYPAKLVIAVFSDDPDTFLLGLGFHMSLSPEEPLHAWIRRTAEAIKAGHAEEVSLLRQMCLSVTVEIRLFPTDGHLNLMAFAGQAREKLGADYEVMYHTPVQTLFKLKGFMDTHECGTSAEELCQAYNGAITTTSGEQVTVELWRAVTIIWQAMARSSEVQKAFLDAEVRFGRKSPFGSMYVLKALVEFADGDLQVLLWITASMSDMVLHLNVSSGEFSLNKLTGGGRVSKTAGLLATMAFKRSLPASKQFFIQLHFISALFRIVK